MSVAAVLDARVRHLGRYRTLGKPGEDVAGNIAVL